MPDKRWHLNKHLMNEAEIVTLAYPDFLPPPNFHSQVNLMKFTYPITPLPKGFPLCLDYQDQIPHLGPQGPIQSDTCLPLNLSSSFYYPCHNHQTYPRAFVCAFLWKKSCLEDSSSAFGRAGSFLLFGFSSKSHLFRITTDKCPSKLRLLSLPSSSLFHQVTFSNTMYHNQ